MTSAAQEPSQLEVDIAAILSIHARPRESFAANSRGRPSRVKAVALAAVLVATAVTILPQVRSLNGSNVRRGASSGAPAGNVGKSLSIASSASRTPSRPPERTDTTVRVAGQQSTRLEPGKERGLSSSRIALRNVAQARVSVPQPQITDISSGRERLAVAAISLPRGGTVEATKPALPAQTGEWAELTSERREVASAARDPRTIVVPAEGQTDIESTLASAQNISSSVRYDPAQSAQVRLVERTRTHRSIDAIRLLRRQ